MAPKNPSIQHYDTALEPSDVLTVALMEAGQNEIPNPLTTAALRVGAKVGKPLCKVVNHESGIMIPTRTLFSVSESSTSPENARFLTEGERDMLGLDNLYIESYLETIFVNQIIPKYPK